MVFQKLDLFPPSGKCEQAATQLGHLTRVNLNQWTLTLSVYVPDSWIQPMFASHYERYPHPLHVSLAFLGFSNLVLPQKSSSRQYSSELI
jgi:hypothetical protein